ncbi:MAG TPA: ATP-binding protein [Chitinophagales bacterium]|nr:ATP-binding protein [Chitinophagales bacterium]
MLLTLPNRTRKWSPKSKFFAFLEDEVTISRILLIAGAIIYPLLGYLYFQENLNTSNLLFINLGCGLVFMLMTVLSFTTQSVKSNLRAVIGIMAYLVMFQSISEAVTVKYEINTTVGLIVTYFMCGLVFKHASQLYYFISITFLILIGSTFLYPEGELKKGVIISVFFSQGLITAIALGSKSNIQEKLRKSNELFQNIFNDSIDANFLADLDTLLIKDCNNKAVLMLDAGSKDDLLGLSCFGLQVQPFSDFEVTDIKNQIKEHWGWSKELEYATKTGRILCGNLEARVVAYDNKPHLLIRINDVTENKRLEQLLMAEKQVLEAAYSESNTDHTLDLLLKKIEEIQPGMYGCILLADREERSLQWIAAPSIPKKLMEEISTFPIRSDALPIGRAAVSKSRVSSASLMEEPYNSRMTFILDTYGFKAATAYPILSEENNLLGVFCAFSKTSTSPTENETEIFERVVSMTGLIIEKDRAISENKKSIEELSNKNIELQKSNSEIDSFVYSTSHDLRAPLLNVVGLIDLTDMQVDDPNVKIYFGLMKESLYKLDDTIKEIIEYYRNKKVEVALTKVDLAKIARDAFNNFRFMEDASQMDLFIDIDNSVSFQCDAKRMGVIFNNLISNAIKFRDPNKESGYIKVRSYASDDAVTIVVEDNGLGIEKQHLKKIFDMFYRGNGTSSGSGLGLYILKEVVGKLNGKISVESKLGKGTQFTLELPNPKIYDHARAYVTV